MDESTGKRCTNPDHEGSNPLPVSEFARDRGKRDGRSNYCRACSSERKRQWRQANPGKAREQERRRHRPGDGGEWSRRWRQANPEKSRAVARDYRERLRIQVFDHYGHACACCGTAERLDIDHINGGGSAHRTALFGRANNGGADFYRWLVAQGFPPGYQVLCRPCNASKANGVTCRLDHSAAA